jgi:hypothetical protein
MEDKTMDISIFKYFSFFEPVYFFDKSSLFRFVKNKEQRRLFGVVTQIGDALAQQGYLLL